MNTMPPLPRLRSLGPMPEGAVNGQTYADLLERYEHLPMGPLEIEVDLVSPYTPNIANGVHLDALLAWAVATQVMPMPDGVSGHDVIPIPARMLYVDERGRPMYAVSDLEARGAWCSGTRYIHQRDPDDRAEWVDKPNVLTTAGRWKEARHPFRVRTTESGSLVGWMIGNLTEVRNLLDLVTHVGKKTAHGMGRVRSWRVKRLDVPVGRMYLHILEHRILPLAYVEEMGFTIPHDRVVGNQTWTYPYWYRPFAAPVVLPARL